MYHLHTKVPNPKPTDNTCLQETRCFDALAELYSDLSEDDILYGLWKRRCIHEGTRAGLSLVQHGYLEQAQDVFLDSMKIDPKAPAPNGQHQECCHFANASVSWDAAHQNSMIFISFCGPCMRLCSLA